MMREVTGPVGGMDAADGTVNNSDQPALEGESDK